MAYSRFQTATFLRLAVLMATLMALIWAVSHTDWYVCMLLLALAAVGQAMLLVHHANRSSREVARFLDAIAFDDTSASFQGLSREGPFAELGAAMTRVLDRLRTGRAEREEQTQYLQTLLAHVPVALISLEDRGTVQLLNLAARRLFESACTDTAQFSRHGEAFAIGMETLKPGESAIVRMERKDGPLQLKGAATDVMLGGARRRLVSLQNIESELTAHELAAWQTVIRVMAHEVMNSLTPITSLASTARDHVGDVLAGLAESDPARAGLADAGDALDTLARRSEGLLQFVQNHRRLTKRMVAQVQAVPARRVFTRLQRLLADELKTRDIDLRLDIEPETLEIRADIDLLDQALINLVRNAIEALRDAPGRKIALRARQENGGRIALTVADNGPGIGPEQREKVFVPFYTTKRQGSGVGLSLVRQIVAVHN
ncbi:MAG TPA: ATP-binding protein, partial [Rhizomicrobium sp.]|nr:ATP-binding protein [Rhizomicrobium sp.]